MPKEKRDRREQLREYKQNQRELIRTTRAMREAGLVDTNYFIDNPRLLAQIRIWLLLGEDYTRREIQKIALHPLPKAELDRLIRVAKTGE
jgi:hypothetical protein